MGKLLAQMKDGDDDKDATAKAWIAANQDLVKSWLPKQE
jgi:ABC-type proline/glycine betaine transport system substrate-binding protein